MEKGFNCEYFSGIVQELLLEFFLSPSRFSRLLVLPARPVKDKPARSGHNCLPV